MPPNAIDTRAVRSNVVWLNDYRPKPMHPVLDLQMWSIAMGLAVLGAVVELSFVWWPEVPVGKRVNQ